MGTEEVPVGHAACQGHGGGGHPLWHCVVCPEDELPVYGPPLASHCTVLEGPAMHRLSNRCACTPVSEGMMRTQQLPRTIDRTSTRKPRAHGAGEESAVSTSIG
jgi:hypothetical protein